MTTDELIFELMESFQHELYPGDLNIVTNNALNYDLEALQIRESFKSHTWLTLPDEYSTLLFLLIDNEAVTINSAFYSLRSLYMGRSSGALGNKGLVQAPKTAC